MGERRRRTPLDEHTDYLLQRWAEGCTNARHLHRELRERGYTGSERTVRRMLQSWREVPEPAAVVKAQPAPKPRDIAATMMRPVDKRTPEETENLARILDRCDVLRQVDQLVSDFAGMARELRGRHLDTWITRVKATGLTHLIGFADGLLRDYDAVRNGLTLDWNSGAVEGNVNRIKMIKRTMYGRANFDLLRRRILLPI